MLRQGQRRGSVAVFDVAIKNQGRGSFIGRTAVVVKEVAGLQMRETTAPMIPREDG